MSRLDKAIPLLRQAAYTILRQITILELTEVTQTTVTFTFQDSTLLMSYKRNKDGIFDIRIEDKEYILLTTIYNFNKLEFLNENDEMYPELEAIKIFYNEKYLEDLYKRNKNALEEFNIYYKIANDLSDKYKVCVSKETSAESCTNILDKMHKNTLKLNELREFLKI